MQQQQVSDDEIYEGLKNMCNDIGCHLKIYEDKIFPFDNTSDAAAYTKRKVPFGGTIGADAAAQ